MIIANESRTPLQRLFLPEFRLLSLIILPGLLAILPEFPSAIQVTSISMEGVLVGEDLNGCAFVYGSLSFADKVACGLALYMLESYQGATKIKSNLGTAFGYSVTRLGLGLVPAACSLLSAIVVYSMDLPDNRRRPLVEPLLA